MERLIDLGNGFWNIRGDLRLFGLLNVGTQASLVRLRSGRFVALVGDAEVDDGVKEHVCCGGRPSSRVCCERRLTRCDRAAHRRLQVDGS